jgi:hypothetical protein
MQTIDTTNLTDQVRYWYNEKTEELRTQAHFSYVDLLINTNQTTSTTNIRNMKMYGQDDLWSGSDFLSHVIDSTNEFRMKLNVIKSVCDTAYNKIGKNLPRPMVLTSGGDRSQQKKAKRLEKFISGVFYNSDFYKKAKKAFKSATILGTGAPHWRICKDGKIKCDNEFINDIIVDEIEGKYGKVRQLHIVKFKSKDEIIEQYPKFQKEIKATMTETDPLVSGTYNTSFTRSSSDSLGVILYTRTGFENQFSLNGNA